MSVLVSICVNIKFIRLWGMNWPIGAWCDQQEFLFEPISTLERQSFKQKTVFIVDTFQWSLCSTTDILQVLSCVQKPHVSQSVNVGPLSNVRMFIWNLSFPQPSWKAKAGHDRVALEKQIRLVKYYHRLVVGWSGWCLICEFTILQNPGLKGTNPQ